jgi:HlyD family secretion protein
MTDGAQKPMTRKVVRTLAVVAALALVSAGVWLAFRDPPDLVQGMADADNVNVSAKITARVARLLVREGDAVHGGQVLFELDSPEVSAKKRQAGAALEAAMAQSAKAEEGARKEDIRAAEANWRHGVAAADVAQATFERLERLFAEGVVTAQTRDEAQARTLGAAAATAAARAQYDLALAGARSQDKEAASAQVRQAEGAVAEVQAAQDEVEGRAPTGGEVNKRLADVGELVPAGYPVFTLVDVSNLWVAFYLREDQFRGLAMQQRLRGQIPALGLDDVEFEVYFINPAGDFATWRATRQSAGYDIKSFEVRVRPVGRVDDFRPGMSVLFPWPQH